MQKQSQHTLFFTKKTVGKAQHNMCIKSLLAVYGCLLCNVSIRFYQLKPTQTSQNTANKNSFFQEKLKTKVVRPLCILNRFIFEMICDNKNRWFARGTLPTYRFIEKILKGLNYFLSLLISLWKVIFWQRFTFINFLSFKSQALPFINYWRLATTAL